MPSETSSASSRPDETLCPHCGRKTRTMWNGECVECWSDKSKRSPYAPGNRPPADPQRPGGGGSTWIDDFFDIFIPWW
jgi:hypothetical protein